MGGSGAAVNAAAGTADVEGNHDAMNANGGANRTTRATRGGGHSTSSPAAAAVETKVDEAEASRWWYAWARRVQSVDATTGHTKVNFLDVVDANGRSQVCEGMRGCVCGRFFVCVFVWKN